MYLINLPPSSVVTKKLRTIHKDKHSPVDSLFSHHFFLLFPASENNDTRKQTVLTWTYIQTDRQTDRQTDGCTGLSLYLSVCLSALSPPLTAASFLGLCVARSLGLSVSATRRGQREGEGKKEHCQIPTPYVHLHPTHYTLRTPYTLNPTP